MSPRSSRSARIAHGSSADPLPARDLEERPAEDLKQAASAEAGVVSYNGNVASVHRRTINETAAVVARLDAKR